MDTLPIEILAEIIQYLPYNEVLRCALINKRFKAAVRQPRFFGKIYLAKRPLQWLAIEDTFKEAEVFPFSTIITDNVNYTFTSMEKVYKLCKNNQESIRRLEVYLAAECLEFQLRWINQFTNVVQLKFYYDCSIEPESIDLSDFQPMETVKVLEVASIINSLDLIEKLLPKLPNLKKINMELGCTIYFYEETKEDSERIQELATKIPELDLSFAEENRRPDDQVSSFRGLIAMARPNITISRIGVRLDSVPLDLVQQLSRTFSNIKYLKIDVESYLTSTTFAEISPSFQHLEYLRVDNIQTWPIDFLMEDLAPCKRLKTLKIHFAHTSSQIEDEELKFFRKVSPMPHLEKLSIECWPMDFDDESFELVMQSFPNLRHFKLEYLITDRHLQLITLHLRRLVKLELSQCLYVTDCGFMFLSDLVNLEKLSIGCVAEITDSAFTCFKLRQLKSLTLNNSKYITDVGIETITEDCPFIEKLTLGKFKEITNTAIEFISKNLHYLKSLAVMDCDKVTEQSQDILESNCKHKGEVRTNMGTFRAVYFS